MPTDTLILLLCALGGTLMSSVISCIPALHIYNVAGLLVVLALRMQGVIPDEALAMWMLGMVVGYAILNTIPSIFLAAPDESAIWIVLPGQKYLMQRRGFEASILTGVGGLGGIVFLLLLSPFAGGVFSTIRTIVAPHLGWILMLVIVYMLLSEWPKGGDRGKTGWARMWDGWKSLLAGLLTFALSGLLGMIIMYRSLVPTEMSFQNLLPAFMGLFAIPWVLTNLVSGEEVPPQHVATSLDVTPSLIARGVAAGSLGGIFAAFFPVVTGGIGGFLAGQATAQRDDRLFLISQGASKVVYYVGAVMLFFVPGLNLTRGGMAWMLSLIYIPQTPESYARVLAGIALCAGLAFFLLIVLSRAAIALVSRVNYRLISGVTLAVLLGIVFLFTGLGGLLIAAVATGIGLIPVLWHSRRMNCMGVLLVPIVLNMAGWGPTVAGWLGLV
jgi:putative membrane protein